MKKIVFLLVSALCMMSVASCSNDEDYYDLSDSDLSWNDSTNYVVPFPAYNGIRVLAGIQLAKKKDLPAWLVEQINVLEQSDPAGTTIVFRGEWAGMTVYYYSSDILSSIFLCIYKDDGQSAWEALPQEYQDTFDENEDRTIRFLNDSKNWYLVYATNLSKHTIIRKL